MTVKERIRSYIKYKGINASEFGRSIGVSAAYISSMVKSIQPDKLKRITLEYPDLNTEWLLTGEGSMLKDSDDFNRPARKDPFDLRSFRILNKLSQDDLSKYFQVPIEWISEIENKQRPMPSDFLDKIENEGLYDVAKGYLLTTEAEISLANNSNYKLLPLVNIDIVGGLSNDVVDASQYVVGYIPFVNAQEGDICCQVTGRSMYPLYPGGCIVQLRKVIKWREYLEYGQVYVIDLEDGRRLIKEIKKGKNDNFFLLVSCNKEFEDREIPTDMIYSIWLVLAKYEKSTM